MTRPNGVYLSSYREYLSDISLIIKVTLQFTAEVKKSNYLLLSKKIKIAAILTVPRLVLIMHSRVVLVEACFSFV